MDKILEAILCSDKAPGLKKQMCHKVEVLGRTAQPAVTITNMLQTSIKLTLSSTEPYVQDACKKIYIVWGRHNQSILESFFTPVLLQGLLDSSSQHQQLAMWFIHETMLIIRSDRPSFHTLCKLIQFEAISYITKYSQYETVVGFCKLVVDFRDCIPKDEKKVAFCSAIVTAAGTFEAPNKTPDLMKKYIGGVTHVVGSLLSYMWHDDQTIIVKCLEQIFKIISHVEEELSPSLSLAAIVPNIPLEYVNSIVKQTVSDPGIADENIKVALIRMIDWLAWPGAKNVETWIIAFFCGLASVHKYTILMEVTETKIEHVYDKLHFPVVRESAFMVISHMLLSYQHSPEPFHKIVEKVPKTVMGWHAERSEASYSLLCRFSILLHTLMSHHLGFPDLYQPVMEALKGLPVPTSADMQEKLSNCSWKSSQKRLSLSGSLVLSRRSETGKTGLVNLGNTCYMNSVIQALFMSDSFRQEVLQRTVSTHEPVLAKLQHVFAFLSATQRAAYAPSEFLKSCRPPWFTPGLQQDCSEFMRYLYDQLHEHERTKLKAHTLSIAHTQNKTGSSLEIADNNSNDAKEQYSTLISETFMGRLVTTFKCLACHNESKHVEMFTDLPLAFPENMNSKGAISSRNTRSVNQKAALVGGASTSKSANVQSKEEEGGEKVVALEDLLSHYLKPEKLVGDNKYHCEMCKGLQDGERVIHLTSPPQYLNLTLLRFAYNVKAKARSKIFTEVTYPKTLRVPVQCARSRARSGAFTGTRGKIKKSKSDMLAATDGHYETYALTAVIVHSGYSSDSGHYYCYARHSIPVDPQSVKTNQKHDKSKSSVQADVDYLQDRWYMFNDSRVTYSRYESFCNVIKTFGKDTAYVLLYKRINSQQDAEMMTVDANESVVTSQVDPPLHQDLRAAVDKDNRLFLQEQELQERSRSLQASHTNSSYYNWKDNDDKGPPGSCGGGGGGGLNTNRLVF